MNQPSGRVPLIALIAFVMGATVYPMLAIAVAFTVVAGSSLGLSGSWTRRAVGVARRSAHRAITPATAPVALGVLAMAALIFAAPVAQAEPNGVTHLNNSNVSQLAGVDVTVTASHSGVNLVLKVRLVTNPLSNTPLGIDQFFYGASNLVLSVSDPTAGGCTWTTNFDGGQADGFGSFLSLKSSCPAGDGGITDDITFTLNGDPSIVSNDHGAHYAIHIRYSGQCSGFISDGRPDQVGSDPGCIPSVPIPGVTDAVIPMASMVAAIILVGRRQKGKQRA